MGKDKVQFTTNLNKDLLTRLKIDALNKGKRVNEILEPLISDYLEENSQEENKIKVFKKINKE